MPMPVENRYTRRRFLKATSVAAASLAFPTLIPSTARGSTGSIAPSNRIVMGTIGIGWQGTNNMLDLLGKQEVQMVAVCDVDQDHLEAAKNHVDGKYGNKDCATYTDFSDLLARRDLDAVCIALPDHWHAIPVIAAARTGLDIHGEKPLSHSLAEGRAICESVRKYGRIWQTGSWQRSVSNFHRACELVRNGRVGKIHRVEVGLGSGHVDFTNTQGQEAPVPPPPELDYDRWLGPAPWSPYCPARVHKNWRWVLDYGGGFLMDWVGHHVDIALWGLDKEHTGPVKIAGKGAFPAEGLWDSPTHYHIECTFADGIEMIIDSIFTGGTKWYGEEGWVYVNRGKLDAHPKKVLEEIIGPDEIHLYKSLDHMQNFLDCIKSRRTTITPCEVAHRAASVGHLGQIAMVTGRVIKWDPDREIIIDDPGASALLGNAYREPWSL